jgi:hypothetical protein
MVILSLLIITEKGNILNILFLKKLVIILINIIGSRFS